LSQSAPTASQFLPGCPLFDDASFFAFLDCSKRSLWPAQITIIAIKKGHKKSTKIRSAPKRMESEIAANEEYQSGYDPWQVPIARIRCHDSCGNQRDGYYYGHDSEKQKDSTERF